ncbi:alpha/beta fold hydrolase [Microbacterium sp. No. 7]|uniref:alpha/beta fold hydrolase n=1 Tax=Microbacterium sp. No. 7 TaxID=1714373 RepID=UPI000A69B2D5|nr:alpha/beta hydrolase [Microbacterium sp. No. 7]
MTDWLDDALAHPTTEATVHVDDARIAYRVWEGPAADATVVLVHGGAAHSHWWDPIAPHLTPTHRVVALDLSGHGDSDWREAYSFDAWAREVLMVTEEAATGPVTLVGHSLGGAVSTRIAGMPGIPRVRAVVAVDSPVGDAAPPRSDDARSPFGRTQRQPYATVEEAIARFRPAPAQRFDPRIGDHIARASLRPRDGGWDWKFDRAAIGAAQLEPVPQLLHAGYTYLRAERGIMLRTTQAAIEQRGGSYLELPDCGHAPMLDRPLVLVTALRTVLSLQRTTG